MLSLMKDHAPRRNRLNLAISAALIGTSLATCVYAQEDTESADKKMEVIRVTGSHVSRNVQSNMSSPIQIVDSEEIMRSGFAGVDDLIVNNTANTGSLGGVNDLAGGGSETRHTRSANLRGLGPSSTLVLLNGHRVASQEQDARRNSYTNLAALVPTIAIQRIETVLDGASAIYGSDAIAGVINIDAMSVAGKAKDLTVTGFGSSQLEDILKPLAAEKGRTLHGETSVQSGFYFRSDHFNFAKAGVPALYADGGEDLRDGGVEAGRKAAEAYGRDRYHGPKDEFDVATWKLDGTVEDLQLLYGVGKELAGGDRWPNWYEGNPFKAARDEMMKGKTEAAAAAPAAK